MSNEPGWYKHADGSEQYWDGAEWLPGEPVDHDADAEPDETQPALADMPPPVMPPPSESGTKSSRFPTWVVTVAAVVGLVVVVTAVTLIGQRDTLPEIGSGTTALQDAYKECAGTKGMKYVSVKDQGHTLTVDTESQYGPIDGMACVLVAIGTPSSITSAMDATTAFMGVQTDSANGFDYRWSYHPDNGVNLVITD